MDAIEAVKSVFSKYVTFSGRARRSEYWYFMLFNLMVTGVLYFVDKAIFPESDPSTYSLKNHIFQNVYSLAVFLPATALCVRRVHDIGKSGWSLLILVASVLIVALVGFLLLWITIGTKAGATVFVIFIYLILFTMLIVEIIFIVWMCKDSEPGANKYGPNPKELVEDLSCHDRHANSPRQHE